MQEPVLYPLRAAVYKTDCSLPDPLVPSVASPACSNDLSLYAAVESTDRSSGSKKCSQTDGTGQRLAGC
jgi:hypothetical protein